ncbi:MAG: succinylglutamate desuccinylase/aspartoacylase family protein [Nocardiaceae bacterium]|nr:succinylglutamate desuccinylase/aspartoacylase family protein [Nocardiaceae bacterium]
MRRESFPIGGVRVRPGKAKNVELPITRLITGQDASLPVRVVHGREDGPAVWLDAAIHGDEINGIEVISQVLAGLDPRTLRGTVVAVPVVNVLGFMIGSRYLPDRRDLNRSFPGSARGSTAARIAHLLIEEVVSKCDVGIDLHTGSDRRTNLPQIRGDLSDPRTRELAEAFGAPVMLDAKLRAGSLRAEARKRGATVLLYEAGEAGRFDHWAIEAGVIGVRRVLAKLGMIDEDTVERGALPAMCTNSGWVRARRTGLLALDVELGDLVTEGQRIGGLSDTFGRRVRLVHADRSGVVIGLTRQPSVNSGDALVHIASVME